MRPLKRSSKSNKWLIFHPSMANGSEISFFGSITVDSLAYILAGFLKTGLTSTPGTLYQTDGGLN